jgi:hypothetical protein
MKKSFFLIILIFVAPIAMCQENPNSIFRNGYLIPEVNYNLPLNEWGIGFRYLKKIHPRVMLGPHVNYFPGLNLTKELYGGIYSSYTLLKSEKKIAHKKWIYDEMRPDLYFFTQLDYNVWFSKNNQLTFTPFIGIGTSRGSSYLKYFVEAKYNFVFNESTLNAGVIFNYRAYKKRPVCFNF